MSNGELGRNCQLLIKGYEFGVGIVVATGMTIADAIHT